MREAFDRHCITRDSVVGQPEEVADTREETVVVSRLGNNTVIEVGVDYVITATEDGASRSSFLVSEGRRNQRILALVGKPGSLATEVILLGEDFFEYCKATSGRLYMATGTVRRAVSREEDTL
jgi:hypothetical protein